MTSLWERALTLLFPHKCFLCGRVLAGTGWLCGECELPDTEGDCCPGCGKRADRCACGETGPVCDGVSAALWYRGGVRGGIHRYKYGGRSYYAPFLAELMERRVRADFAGVAFDLVTWVPLHRKKLRQRGFCQTELLAEELSRRLGAPARGGVLLHTGRGGSQASQEGVLARERNAGEAFALRRDAALAGETVLLVDDVLTTGATARRCAALLKKAGAGAVYLSVAATTPAVRTGISGKRPSSLKKTVE